MNKFAKRRPISATRRSTQNLQIEESTRDGMTPAESHEIPIGGQGAPEILLARATVHRGEPGEPDTALSAQHGNSTPGFPWKGGDTAIQRDYRLQGFRAHRNAHQEAGGHVLGRRALRVQPRTPAYRIYSPTAHRWLKTGTLCSSRRRRLWLQRPPTSWRTSRRDGKRRQHQHSRVGRHAARQTIRDYTSRVDFVNNSATTTPFHTVSVSARIGRITGSTRGRRRGQQSPTDDAGEHQPAIYGGSEQQGESTGGMAPN